MIQGGRDQLWQRKEFKTNERTMMRGETLRTMRPMHLRPVKPLRKTNKTGWAEMAKEGRGGGMTRVEAEGKWTKKARHPVRLEDDT